MINNCRIKLKISYCYLLIFNVLFYFKFEKNLTDIFKFSHIGINIITILHIRYSFLAFNIQKMFYFISVIYIIIFFRKINAVCGQASFLIVVSVYLWHTSYTYYFTTYYIYGILHTHIIEK